MIDLTLDSFVTGFWTIVSTFASWMLNGSLYVIKAALYYVFDGLLTIIYTIVNGLNFTSLAINTASNWANLPPQAIYLLNQLAVSQCIAMIISAIVIRMTLNLIPSEFTRL